LGIGHICVGDHVGNCDLVGCAEVFVLDPFLVISLVLFGTMTISLGRPPLVAYIEHNHLYHYMGVVLNWSLNWED